MFDKNYTNGINLPAAPYSTGIAAFNIETIQRLLDSKGVIAFHIKHALSPEQQNIITGENLEQNTTSFLYYDIRPIRVVPQSMDAQAMIMQYSIDSMFNKVMLNVGGYYLDNIKQKERVLIRPNDLFIFNPTITMGDQQVFEANSQKTFKLPYYVSRVDFMADNNKKVYTQDQDFIIKNGKIVFNEHQNDKVFTVVYEHPLIYNVQTIPHYIRILQANEGGVSTKPRNADYAPQLMFCQHIKIQNFGEDVYDWFRNEKIQNYQQWLKAGKFT